MATIIIAGKTARGDVEAALRKALANSDHKIFQYHDWEIPSQPVDVLDPDFLSKPSQFFPNSISDSSQLSRFTAPRILLAMRPFLAGESYCGIYLEEEPNFLRKSEYRCSDWCVVGDIWRELGELLPDILVKPPEDP